MKSTTYRRIGTGWMERIDQHYRPLRVQIFLFIKNGLNFKFFLQIL